MVDLNSEELGLDDYVALFQRRWRWIVGSVVIIVALVTAFTLTRDKTYSSRAEVEILTIDNQALFQQRESELFREPLAELSYFYDDKYLAAVEREAGFPVEILAELRAQSTDQDTDEINVLGMTVEATSAQRAHDGADAAAQVYLQRRLNETRLAFTDRLAIQQTTRDSLVDRRTVLNLELETARSQRELAETDSDRLAADSNYQLLLAERQPRLNSLSGQIGQLDVEISRLESVIRDLEDPDSIGELRRQADLPTSPESPDVPRNILLAIVGSVIIGAILAIVRDLLDGRARDGAELARLVDIPVMATIGEIRSQRGAPGGVRAYFDLSAEESSGYQVLLNSLWISNADDPLQSIVFTSDRARVGKTQTVINLAQAEAARGTRVLVIDTDFVNPSVADRLGVGHHELGLADLLSGAATIEEVVLETSIPTLHVIDSHTSTLASDLLRSDRLTDLLTDLYSTYDLILIDAMPTLSTADSRLVASQADAVVVVYDPAESRREELQHTIDLLRGSRANLIGLVANKSRATHPVYLAAHDR